MEPRGGRIVDLVPPPDADPSKLVTGYISPASNITIAGLDTRGGQERDIVRAGGLQRRRAPSEHAVPTAPVELGTAPARTRMPGS